jgi:hypothetical protein
MRSDDLDLCYKGIKTPIFFRIWGDCKDSSHLDDGCLGFMQAVADAAERLTVVLPIFVVAQQIRRLNFRPNDIPAFLEKSSISRKR